MLKRGMHILEHLARMPGYEGVPAETLRVYCDKTQQLFQAPNDIAVEIFKINGVSACVLTLDDRVDS